MNDSREEPVKSPEAGRTPQGSPGAPAQANGKKEPSPKLIEAMRGLTDALRSLDDTLGRVVGQPYKAAGEPFGPERRAMLIWLRYGERTTRN